MRSVYKFGGSSIKSAAAIKQIADLILACPNDALVVLSATYNSTNELESIYFSEDSNLLVEDFFTKHRVIIEELNLQVDLSNFKEELLSYLTLPKSSSTLDSIYSIGERISTSILASYIQQQGRELFHADARDYILTNRNFNEAKVLFKNTKANCKDLNKHSLIITQGFIARTTDGQTSTLGREGSDYSAAIFAWALDDVQELVIWKDVKGVYGHDPKVLTNAPLIHNLSYRQTKLLTNKGAKILFHRTMNPLIEANLPLIVKSVFYPNEAGSCISDAKEDHFCAISTERDEASRNFITVFGLPLENAKLLERSFEVDENNDDYFTLEVDGQDLREWIDLFGDQLFS
ncbi:aspartate kinase [Oceanospirillum sp. RT-1-3]|uniref:aspartate kinase n=1 Tax=unclassified Halobacteriovorax TaxID=2639665 RepID=UPI0039996285